MGLEPIYQVLPIAPSTYLEQLAQWRGYRRVPSVIGR